MFTLSEPHAGSRWAKTRCMLLQKTCLSLSGITDFVYIYNCIWFSYWLSTQELFSWKYLIYSPCLHFNQWYDYQDIVVSLQSEWTGVIFGFTLFFYKTHTEWSICEKVQWHSLTHKQTVDCFLRCIDLFHNGHNYSVLIPRSWAQSFEVYHSSTRLISELKYRSKDQKLHKWIMFSEPKPCWNVVGFFCSKSIPRHYVRCNSLSWFSNKILNSSFVPSHDIFKYCTHWRLMMTQVDR